LFAIVGHIRLLFRLQNYRKNFKIKKNTQKSTRFLFFYAFLRFFMGLFCDFAIVCFPFLQSLPALFALSDSVFF